MFDKFECFRTLLKLKAHNYAVGLNGDLNTKERDAFIAGGEYVLTLKYCVMDIDKIINERIIFISGNTTTLD